MLLFAEMRVEEIAQVSFESVEVLLEIFAERSVSHGKTLIKEWDFGIEKCPCFFAGRARRGNKGAMVRWTFRSEPIALIFFPDQHIGLGERAALRGNGRASRVSIFPPHEL